MTELELLFSGMPIIITTKRFQARKHRKKRINKKWAKKYGFTEYESMPHGCPLCFNGAIYMTQRDFDNLGLDKRRVKK